VAQVAAALCVADGVFALGAIAQQLLEELKKRHVERTE